MRENSHSIVIWGWFISWNLNFRDKLHPKLCHIRCLEKIAGRIFEEEKDCLIWTTKMHYETGEWQLMSLSRIERAIFHMDNFNKMELSFPFFFNVLFSAFCTISIWSWREWNPENCHITSSITVISWEKTYKYSWKIYWYFR